MTTQPLLFQPHDRREVVANFDGGTIISDAGELLLREVEQRFGIIRQFARCFTDHRDEDAVEMRAKQGVPVTLRSVVDCLPSQSVVTLRRGLEKMWCVRRRAVRSRLQRVLQPASPHLT